MRFDFMVIFFVLSLAYGEMAPLEYRYAIARRITASRKGGSQVTERETQTAPLIFELILFEDEFTGPEAALIIHT